MTLCCVLCAIDFLPIKKKVRPYAPTMAHLQNLAYEKII